MSDRHDEFLAFLRICDYRARCYVQGSAYHDKLKSVQPLSGRWSVHFKSHPRVQEAERDGWSRDLRAALVAECKRRLMKGEDLGEPDELMPTRKEWWEGTLAKAERERLGAEYQARAFKDAGDAPKRKWPAVDRVAWEARRVISRTRHGNPISKASGE